MQDYVARLGDGGFWAPYLAEIVARHGLAGGAGPPVAGVNATYPTFLCSNPSGDLAVKLFGYFHPWRRSHAAERAAYALLASDPEIAAPRLLGEGRLFDGSDAPWSYLITSRMAGAAAWRAELSAEERLSLAAELGRQVKRLHALPTTGLASRKHWPIADLKTALAKSSLPPHLIAQAETYLARLGPFDRVFTHGDITANHVFVAERRLAGIIDWGDALAADRHSELIQPYRDLFGCDKALLQTFLEASDWPVGRDFDRKTLGLALIRQAIGATQHRSMDVFEPIAERFPLQDIATLDELARELFAL